MSNPQTNPETQTADSAVIRGDNDTRSGRRLGMWITLLVVLLVLLGILWW